MMRDFNLGLDEIHVLHRAARKPNSGAATQDELSAEAREA